MHIKRLGQGETVPPIFLVVEIFGDEHIKIDCGLAYWRKLTFSLMKCRSLCLVNLSTFLSPELRRHHQPTNRKTLFSLSLLSPLFHDAMVGTRIKMFMNWKKVRNKSNLIENLENSHASSFIYAFQWKIWSSPSPIRFNFSMTSIHQKSRLCLTFSKAFVHPRIGCLFWFDM